MAVVNIGTLLQVRYDNGNGWVDEHLFQNCNAVEGAEDNQTNGVVDYDGRSYEFLNFVYQGATRTRNGDNLESILVLASNKISSGYAQKILEGHAVNSNGETNILPYQVVVTTCLMQPNFSQVKKVICTEYWMAASMAYDVQTLEVLLTSGIDAVAANISNMFLSTKRVGALPTTAQIRSL
jgi:hypothetical protein